MMTSPMVPLMRSTIDMITSWKDIAATPALIAWAAVFRTMRMNDLRVTRSFTRRAEPATSASVPGGRSTTPPPDLRPILGIYLPQTLASLYWAFAVWVIWSVRRLLFVRADEEQE